jgi:hypothetical protein
MSHLSHSPKLEKERRMEQRDDLAAYGSVLADAIRGRRDFESMEDSAVVRREREDRAAQDD